MDPKLRENAKRLQLRPQDFPELLKGLGFGPPQHLGTPGEGGAFAHCIMTCLPLLTILIYRVSQTCRSLC